MNGSNPWIRWFASHPTAANLLMLLFLFVGVMTVRDLRRETFPDYSASEVEITVEYPGATAADVEYAVCQRIEDALDSVEYMKEVRGEAMENRARVVAEMTEEGDLDRFLDDVKTEVEAIDDFPDQAEAPVIRLLNRNDLVVAVAVTGPMAAPDLKAWCEGVKDRLRMLPEVSQVELAGFSDHQIRIEVPARALLRHSLSLTDVADAVSRQSVDLPAGSMQTKDGDVLVRFAAERRKPREFEDLVVASGETGAEVRLGDIATITDRFELDEDRIEFDGKRAGLLQINKTKTEDALRIMDAVARFLERERAEAPPGVDYTLTRNVSKIVRDRLDMLVENGVLGLLLVFGSMWLFFSLRFSFWVAMGLPVSFMGAFFGMQAVGMSLNMITMVGLLLATGLLMDDAIVVSENVAAHLGRGKTPLHAAIDGTSEVAGGVLSSYLTTVCVFGSLAVLIKGHIGQVLWVMPLVLILTLTVSLVEAFCILPHHLAHSLRKEGGRQPNRFRKWVEKALDAVRDRVLGRAVDLATAWRYPFLGLVAAVFLASVAMPAGGVLKFEVFPDIDGDVLEARVLLPQGTPLPRTEAVVGRIVDALAKADEHFTPLQPLKDGKPQRLVRHVNVQYAANADAYETGPHVATVSVDLLDAELRGTSLDELAAFWREAVGRPTDVIAIAYKEPVIMPGGLAIDIRLQGPDLDQLKQASLELQEWLNRYRGVLDLSDDLRPGKPEMRVALKPGARVLGLESEAVARQLRTAFQGWTADEIQVGSEAYDVDVRLAKPDQDSLADLEELRVAAPDGSLVPLGSVARIEPGRGWARIARVDSMRTVTIRGDVDTRMANAAEVLADTQDRFLPGLLERHPGIRVSLEGQASEGKTTMQSMRLAMVVGLFGIFLLLSFQFKSYLEPLTVMSVIPLALTGVIWGHLLMGLNLCMPSIMGFVSLAGVVVNDSILLVQFIKLRAGQGMSVPEAARQASRDRFRAVSLTSLTTIMGLAPLMLERSLQAQVLIPLAAAIVFGLMATTGLVLLVVPALYAVFDDLGLAKAGPGNPEGTK